MFFRAKGGICMYISVMDLYSLGSPSTPGYHIACTYLLIFFLKNHFARIHPFIYQDLNVLVVLRLEHYATNLRILSLNIAHISPWLYISGVTATCYSFWLEGSCLFAILDSYDVSIIFLHWMSVELTLYPHGLIWHVKKLGFYRKVLVISMRVGFSKHKKRKSINLAVLFRDLMENV